MDETIQVKEQVVLVKTVGGELYIGSSADTKSTYRTKDSVLLKDPRILLVQRSAQGSGVAALPVVPFVIKDSGEVTIAVVNIVALEEESNIDSSIVSGYRSQVTGIEEVTKPDIII